MVILAQAQPKQTRKWGVSEVPMWKDEMGIESGQKWSNNGKEGKEGLRRKTQTTGFLCVSLAGIELADQTSLELKRVICLCHLSARIKGVHTTTIRLRVSF